MQESRCFSPSLKQYVDDKDEHMDTACYDADTGMSKAGNDLVKCEAESEAACPTEPFFKYTVYGPCDATCEIEMPCEIGRQCKKSGLKEREATCVKDFSDGLMTSAEAVAAGEDAFECTEDSETSSECEVTCRNPLVRFIKTESECESSGCDVEGTITTTYTSCTSGRGCMRYEGVTEAGSETTPCPAVPCDYDACAEYPCINADESYTDEATGKCVCVCSDGFSGSRCHIADDVSYSVLDSSGMRCASGVTDKNRNCCSEGVEVDGCGYCANVEVDGLEANRVGYDIDGQCCSSSSVDAFLTGDFSCCESPDLVDECGVCNGSGDTCTKRIDGTLVLSPGVAAEDFSNMFKSSFPTFIQDMLLLPGEEGNPGRRLQQDPTTVPYILEAGAQMTTAQLALGFITTGVAASTGDSAILSQAPENPDLSTMGEIGDGFCGSGETTSNSPDDCFEAIPCPQATAVDEGGLLVYVGSPTLSCSAKGTCMSASGTCTCNAGYIGDACDRCDGAAGYVLIPLSDDPAAPAYACSTTGADHPPIPEEDVPPGTPPAAGEPSTPTTDAKKGLGMGALIGIIVGAVGGVVVIAGVAFFVLRMRAGKEVSPV